MDITLKKSCAKIVDNLINGLNPDNRSRIINNSSAFMPVHVEVVKFGASFKHVSIAHYRKLNGDLLQDPEMLFHVQENIVWYNATTMKDELLSFITPIWFYEGGRPLKEAVVLEEDGHFKKYYPSRVKTQIEFAEMWLKNIKQQQDI